MSPQEARTVTIDRRGIAWAYHLGRRTWLETRGTGNAVASKLCPFSEGTPHRVHWYAGWKAAKS